MVDIGQDDAHARPGHRVTRRISLPAIGLALTLIAGPFQPLERVLLKLPLDSGQMLIILTLCAYVLRALGTREWPWRWPAGADRAIPFAITLFFSAAALSYVNARDPRDFAFECFKLLQLLLVCLTVGGARNPRERALILGALLLSGAIEALLGIWQWNFRGIGPESFRLADGRYRAYGSFEQPNPLGGYMGLLWPLAAALAAQLVAGQRLPIRRARWTLPVAALCAGVALLALAALFASGSRGALTGLACAVGVMALALVKRPAPLLAALALAGLTLFATNVIQVPASLDQQLAEYGDIDVRDTYLTKTNFSTVERLAHWQAAVRMIEAHPWLGVGYGNYGAAYDEYRLIVWVNALGHAHNYYLNVFAETGLTGMLAYLAWWAVALTVAWRRARLAGPHAWLALGILGSLAHLSGHHLFDNLYVANLHLTLGALLGLLAADGAAASARPISRASPGPA